MSLELQKFDIALLQNDNASLQAMIAEADKAACNDLLLDAGEHFGFPTMLLDDGGPDVPGIRVMLARDLAKIFYDSESLNAAGQITKRYGYEFLPLGTYSHDVKNLIRQHFSLPSSSPAKLATWQHFVIIGMYGQTDAARKVKAYLLERERRARIDDKMVEATGQTVGQLEKGHGIVARDVRTQVAIDMLLRLEEAEQQLEAQKDMIIATQRQAIDAIRKAEDADKKSTMAIEDGRWMTIEEFVLSNGLLRQFPRNRWQAAAKWLAEWGHRHGIASNKSNTPWKTWKQENTYHVSGLMAWIDYETHKPVQLVRLGSQGGTE